MTKNKKTISWLLVIAWMAIIYYLSSIPQLHSGLPSRWDLLFRKLAHITEYAILTALIWNAARQMHAIRITSWLLAAVGATGYAMLDEYHQSFVFGRSGNWVDVGIDVIGVVIALLIVWRKK